MTLENATARRVIPGLQVVVANGRLIVSAPRLQPVTAREAEGAILTAVDPGDAANRWPVTVQRWHPDTYIVSDGVYSTIIHVRDNDGELVLTAPGRCRAGAFPRRKLTGSDVTDRMDITDRRLAAGIAEFANWLMEVQADGR